MTTSRLARRSRGSFASLASLLTAVATGGVMAGELTDVAGTPVADALELVGDDVRIFNEHIVTLASPYMEGRVPGSQGMERAKDYVQYWMERYGLEPAFPAEVDGQRIPFTSYRDSLPLGGQWKVTSESLAATTDGATISMVPERDFVATGLGGSGDLEAPAVFVGYAIDEGPDGYASFAEDDDLTGRIAVMFRFEPMDEEGRSLWSEGRRWSGRAGFNRKVRSAIKRGAEGVVIINTPGADDGRVNELGRFSGRGGVGVPVVLVSPLAAETLLADADPRGRSLMELRRHADEGGGIVELNTTIAMAVEAANEDLMAENVGGLIPGQGELADEYIVVGAHLDHLGMGYFGSRTGPGSLHPGADDNASGSAGVLLLSKMLMESFAEMPEDQPRRSVLLICFTGEESGLNGSRHYVEDPVVPIDQHTLMINWDMIGRISNDRLTVSGANTGEGLKEFLQPHLDASGLDIQAPERMSGASDHSSFRRAGVPVLFSIIADFHEDFHTPNDESWKINRVGATKTVHMYHDIVAAAAQRPDGFAFVDGDSAAGPRGPSRSNIKVRFGIRPESYTGDGEPGIPIASVTEGGSADEAGIQEGDRLLRWDGKKIADMADWMGMLAEHEEGDEVKVGVLRDGEEVTLDVVLQGR